MMTAKKMMAKTSKKSSTSAAIRIKKLKFEYCECGCHGHEATLGKLYFWIFNDLKGKFFLHNGHGWLAPTIGSYTSFKDAEKKANEMVKASVTSMLV